MADQAPHSPAPAYPPTGSREPDWTTGQGIGFLVALPGWIIVGLAGWSPHSPWAASWAATTNRSQS